MDNKRSIIRLNDIRVDLTTSMIKEDVEQSILGSLLVDESLFQIAKKIITPDMFHRFKGISETIFSVLQIDKVLTKAKVVAYGAKIGHQITSNEIDGLRMKSDSDNFEYYCNVLQSSWYSLERTMLSTSFIEGILSGGDCDTLTSKHDAEILRLESIKNDLSYEARSFSDDIESSFQKVKNAFETGEMITGFDTGIDELTKLTGGFQRGELSIIGGEPGRGKSTLGLQFFRYIGESNTPVLFVSIEMTPDQYNFKLFSSKINIPVMKVRSGNFDEHDLERLRQEKDILKTRPFFSEIKKMHFTEIEKTIRYHVQINKVEFVLIDHLGLIKGDSFNSLDQKYNEFSDGFKVLAKELDIHIQLLAQRNRSSQGRPTSSSLKYGGDAAADLIMFPFNILEDSEKKGRYIPTDLEITKNRSTGRTGAIETFFDTESDTYIESIPNEHYAPFSPIKDNLITRKSDYPEDWS